MIRITLLEKNSVYSILFSFAKLLLKFSLKYYSLIVSCFHDTIFFYSAAELIQKTISLNNSIGLTDADNVN